MARVVTVMPVSRSRMGFAPDDASRRRRRSATALVAPRRHRRSVSAFVASALQVAFALVLSLFVAHGAIARGTAPTIGVDALPPEGRAVLTAIRAGGPFVSRRDGIVFGNREGLLPNRRRGYYAEYTVPTPGARTRGARRIIAGRGTSGDVRTSGEYYYTNDHYQSFRRIVP